MTRSDKVALFALGVILIAIMLVSAFDNGISMSAMDQGWATLIAAFLGLCAIAYQTRVGFKNLRASAVEQSNLDRSAQEHQADLNRRALREVERRQASTLAAALAAEIASCEAQVRAVAPMLWFQLKVYEQFGENKITHPFEIANHVPKFDPLVYKANVGHFGLLGPSTAHDVVSVYNMLLFRPAGSMTDVPASMVAIILRGYVEAFENWLLDAKHVHNRLLAVYAGKPDPGALFENRAARKKPETPQA